jgi:large subunit ribosomal protein L11
MAKKITKKVKLQIPAGKANPAPPIGTNLGPTGINIADFCKKFNDMTSKMAGDIVPVDINIYEDRTFSFVLKTPPASFLIKKAAGVEKGSGKNRSTKVGKITLAQAREIAEKKMPDLSASSIEAAIETIKGSARSMGIEVVG